MKEARRNRGGMKVELNPGYLMELQAINVKLADTQLSIHLGKKLFHRRLENLETT